MRPTPRILAVDDERDFLETIRDSLSDAGYEVVLASSAAQALEIVSRGAPDLVLLDLAMPAVDGIQLLRYFRTRHTMRRIPVVILSAAVRKETLFSALELGVKDVLLKSKFSIQELVDRIEGRLAEPVAVVRNPNLDAGGRRKSEAFRLGPSVHPAGSDRYQVPEPDPMRPLSENVVPASLRTSSPTSDMIEAISHLRALPRIVEDILQMAASSDSSLGDLEDLVRRDPVVAAKILQGANSASFLRGSPVVDLAEAIRVLGFANITRIVATSSILDEESLEGLVGTDLLSLWRHCLAAGTFAERAVPVEEKPAAFLGGLLHDLPSLFALQYLGSDWLPWREHARIKGLALHEALSQALGCPLESISSQILSAYRIPVQVAHSIQEYHEFFLAHHPLSPGIAARRLDLAHLCAVSAGRAGTELGQVRCVLQEESNLSRMDFGRLGLDDPSALAVREEDAGLGAMSDLPGLSVPVVLWRDLRWLQPDPVEAVLQLATDLLRVDRFDELPQSGRARLAVAEPGSIEWVRLGVMAPVLVLHRSPLPEEGVEPGVVPVRMPVSVSRLMHLLSKMPVV